MAHFNNEFQWPVEMLGQILHFLAMDGATSAWLRLVHLTRKNTALKNIAKQMQLPLVLRVTVGAETNLKFLVPFQKANNVSIEIEWGDSNPRQIIHGIGKGYAEHVYNAVGEYTVRVFPHGNAIDGVWLDHLGCDDTSYLDLLKLWWRPLQSLDSLGSLGIRSLEALFYSAETFNLPLAHLDVSGVKKMRAMFYEAKSFNQPIGRWDVSNVTDMSFMFSGASSFNQDISRWNVSKVTTLTSMFSDTNAFNQPIGSWNVSSAIDMSFMFCNAKSFNQPIGSWDVRSVADMRYMFSDAEQFNQDIGSWKVSQKTRIEVMFDGAAKFDMKFIDRWNLPHEEKAQLFW